MPTYPSNYGETERQAFENERKYQESVASAKAINKGFDQFNKVMGESIMAVTQGLDDSANLGAGGGNLTASVQGLGQVYDFTVGNLLRGAQGLMMKTGMDANWAKATTNIGEVAADLLIGSKGAGKAGRVAKVADAVGDTSQAVRRTPSVQLGPTRPATARNMGGGAAAQVDELGNPVRSFDNYPGTPKPGIEDLEWKEALDYKPTQREINVKQQGRMPESHKKHEPSLSEEGHRTQETLEVIQKRQGLSDAEIANLDEAALNIHHKRFLGNYEMFYDGLSSADQKKLTVRMLREGTPLSNHPDNLIALPTDKPRMGLPEHGGDRGSVDTVHGWAEDVGIQLDKTSPEYKRLAQHMKGMDLEQRWVAMMDYVNYVQSQLDVKFGQEVGGGTGAIHRPGNVRFTDKQKENIRIRGEGSTQLRNTQDLNRRADRIKKGNAIIEQIRNE